MRTLFRPEVAGRASNRLAGEVVLASPLQTWVLVLGLCGVVASAFCFAAMATYTRRETVVGWVVPTSGLIRVAARSGGTVTRLSVDEGRTVRLGEPLAELRLSSELADGDAALALDHEIVAEGAAAAAQAASARTKLRSKQSELGARLRILRSQVPDAKQRVHLLTARREIADAAVTRGLGLAAKGYMPSMTLDNLRATALVAAQDASIAADHVHDLRRQISDLEHELAGVPTEVASTNAQLAQNSAALSQRRLMLQAQSVYRATAPVAGRVVAIPVEPGQTVEAGSAVVVLVPEGSDLIAELYVPSRAAGFIRAGQEVRLMYQAFPYQTFGTGRGWVRSVSRTVLAPREVAIPGLSLEQPVFRVRVQLERAGVLAYGDFLPLRPGMLLTADVITDRRTLLQWLLDPLYAAGRRA